MIPPYPLFNRPLPRTKHRARRNGTQSSQCKHRKRFTQNRHGSQGRNARHNRHQQCHGLAAKATNRERVKHHRDEYDQYALVECLQNDFRNGRLAQGAGQE